MREIGFNNYILKNQFKSRNDSISYGCFIKKSQLERDNLSGSFEPQRQPTDKILADFDAVISDVLSQKEIVVK